MCKEQNIFLIDYSEKIKENHLNSSNLHLNRGEAKILSTSFLQYISKIFKWVGQSEVDFQIVLKSLRRDNLNKLVPAHLTHSFPMHIFSIL